MSGDQYQEVCLELDRALHREERAQELLKQQNEQLNDLGFQVDLHTSLEAEKDICLTDTAQVCQKVVSVVTRCWTRSQEIPAPKSAGKRTK